MAEHKLSQRKKEKGGLGLTGMYCMALAASGWLVLMANMFGIAGSSGWIFPQVADIPGLAASTLLLAFIALTPVALRQLFRRKDPSA